MQIKIKEYLFFDKQRHTITFWHNYNARRSGVYRCKIIQYEAEKGESHLNWNFNGADRYVTLDHKTSHKGKFSKIEIYTSSESWINQLSIGVWFVRIGQYLAEIQIWNLRVQKNLNIEKITFKVVQMKFLAMHITNQKLSFDIFTVGNLQNIFMEHDLYLMS